MNDPPPTPATSVRGNIHTQTFVGRDLHLNITVTQTGAELRGLLDQLLPLLRRQDATIEDGVVVAGTRQVDVQPALVDALRQYIAATASDETTSPHQRTESYLARLCVDPALRQWHTRYVLLSGGYRPTPDLERRFSEILVRGDGPQRQIERVHLPDIRAALDKHNALILLAPPGAGKTTVLQRLTLDLARQRLQNAAARLPLLASLSAQKPEEQPIEFLRRVWCAEQPGATEHDFQQALQMGQLCILCDALNEARRANYRSRIDDWRDFAARLPTGNRLVFTCRSQDYYGELAVQQVEIDLLSPAQIQDFARLYLGAESGAALWQRLTDAGETLLPLAQIPYYLHMIVDVFQSVGDLPAHRAGLFQRFALELLTREEQKRHPDWIDLRALHIALSKLAFAMQELGTGTTLSQTAAHSALPPAVTLPHGETIPTPIEPLCYLGRAATLLSETPDGSLRFTHHLLQEYFAAEELLRRHAQGPQLNHLWRVPSRTADMPDAARGQWDPLPLPPTSGWEQTTILASGLNPDLVDAIQPVNPALAARCLLELGEDANPQQVDASRQALLTRLASVTIHLRSRLEAGLLLGRLGAPRFPVETINGVRVILPPMLAIDPRGATIGSSWWTRTAEARERPRHAVSLAPYAIGRYPVTNAEYACFMAAGGYDHAEYWSAGGQHWLRGEAVPGEEDPADWWLRTWQRFKDNPQEIDTLVKRGQMAEFTADRTWRILITWPKEQVVEQVRKWYPSGEQARAPRYWHDDSFNNPSQPVVGICWYEAVAYANWLAAVTGTPYRLPSEAEWEWAARQGRRTFPWGNRWEAGRCNALEGRVMRTTPVGAYPHGATPHGPPLTDSIHDLSGNVWEWTATRYADYPYDPNAGLEELDATGVRITRGGGWAGNQQMVRCAFRYRHAPWDRHNPLGYRLARLLSL